MIPYSCQDITEQDIEAVVATLRSDWLTQGPAIKQFEQAVAQYCGARYAVAVSHGTAALHLACMALELGPDDALWTCTNSFVASANCGRYCGAQVDFVDIDPDTLNMSVSALRTKLERAATSDKLPKIVIPVHFAGQSCDMQAIAELAQEYGFRVIEDASHALSGEYKGNKIGSCEFADMTVFSFHPVKPMTTGEGGMITCKAPELEKKLRLLASHGITRDAGLMQNTPHGDWYYEHLELGYNYRITDLQAALGLSQLGRLDQFWSARQRLAQVYDEAFKNLPLKRPWQHPDTRSAWHLYVIQLGADASVKRKALYTQLKQSGIGVNVHYMPIHLQPYYRALGHAQGDFPAAEAYYENALSLPLHPRLSNEQQQYIIDQIEHILS